MQRYKDHMVTLAGSLTLLLAVSCKKDIPPATDDPPPAIGEPAKKPIGQPTADPFTAFIGPHGGVISYDGSLRMAILPQTMEQPTAFSVQPITNTLDETSPIKAYRLKPEGVHFQKPVRLTLSYDGNTAGNPKTRMVAFQREDGVWCGVPTVLDEAKRQLTVETTHFSDWVWFDFITLRKDRESVGAGGQVTLKLMEQVLGALTTNQIDSVPLAALDDIGVSKDLTVSGWRIVSGPGKLEPKINAKLLPGHAIYTAPAAITAPTDVEIEVELESRNGYIGDPSAPNGRRKFGKLLLTTSIRLVPENFVQLKVNGVVYPLPQTGNVAQFVNGMIHVRAGGQQSSKSIVLQYGGTDSGTYNGGSQNNQSLLSMTETVGDARVFHVNYYRTCEDDSHRYNGTAAITVTANFVEGTFQGNAYPLAVQGCEIPEPKTIDIRFKIPRTNHNQ